MPMRECGSLVCLWPWDEDCDDEDDEKKVDSISDDDNAYMVEKRYHKKLMHVLRESHMAGDTNASYLDSKSVSEIEPSLSSRCRGAIHIPGEIVVDPWLIPVAYAMHSRQIAKQSMNKSQQFHDVIQTGKLVCMDQSSFDTKTNLWTVVTKGTTEKDDVVIIKARSVINAAGISCENVQTAATTARCRQEKLDLPMPDFEARPRRGQYIVYSVPKGTTNSELNKCLPTRPIQPVPTDRTKGIFVYSTLYDQIVVGPTAKDQDSLRDDDIEQDVAENLARHASRILGRTMGCSSNDQLSIGYDVVGEYVGIRPGTNKRDYQIQLHYSARFITVGGIRSTGLSASLGIGRHVVQCLLAIIVHPPKLPCQLRKITPTPLPNLDELVAQYHKRNDGTIEVDGHCYKVTHPLTKFGWNAKTGLAQPSMKSPCVV